MAGVARTERLSERVAQMWLEGHVGARRDMPSWALQMIQGKKMGHTIQDFKQTSQVTWCRVARRCGFGHLDQSGWTSRLVCFHLKSACLPWAALHCAGLGVPTGGSALEGSEALPQARCWLDKVSALNCKCTTR